MQEKSRVVRNFGLVMIKSISDEGTMFSRAGY